MNIIDKVNIHSCTSCGVCALACAKKAITIVLDKDGFYRPIVNTSLCNNCGLCTTVCYKFDNDVKKTAKDGLKHKPLYSAWAIDDNVVKKTTSGGIGDMLAHHFYREGYKVIGVVYNEEKTRAEHRVARNEEELNLFRGSKYIQSYTFDAFKDIIRNSRTDRYAVFGTPCQIYALNKLVTQKKIRDNFCFVDLYCHGCPSLNAWTKYQEEVKTHLNVDKFDGVNFRSKKRGWGNFYIEVQSGEKTLLTSKCNDKFYELFFSNMILNEACSDCILRSSLEYTDIRLGDFWGIKFLDNHRGVSAISLATEKGRDIFEKLDLITQSRCSYDDFLPFQSWGVKYAVEKTKRNNVLASLSNKKETLDSAIKVLRVGEGGKSKMKRCVRTFLEIFPLGLTNAVKKIVYNLRKIKK